METNQSRSNENVDHQREGSCNVRGGRNGQSSALESESGPGTLTMKDGESGRRTTRYKLAKNGIKDGSSSQGTSKKSETLSGLEKAIMDENNELRERIISHLMENRLPLTNIRRLVKTYSDNDSISVSTRYLCLKNYDLALRKSENNTFRRKIDKLESEIKELKTTVAKQEKMLLEEKRRLEKFRPVDIERRKLIRENEKLQREINAMKGEKANQQTEDLNWKQMMLRRCMLLELSRVHSNAEAEKLSKENKSLKRSISSLRSDLQRVTILCQEMEIVVLERHSSDLKDIIEKYNLKILKKFESICPLTPILNDTEEESNTSEH